MEWSVAGDPVRETQDGVGFDGRKKLSSRNRESKVSEPLPEISLSSSISENYGIDVSTETKRSSFY